MNGVTANYSYTYDAQGRLLTVQKDGTLVEEYQYNNAPNPGLRTYEMNTLRGIVPGRSLTYNTEDQLLSVGGATYLYNADGYLAQKSGTGGTTTYTYSTRGELLTAALPDTRVISYVYDPLGRRIAKKINGTITEKYLWAGLTRLLAVYDGSDNLLMRFEYADGRMPYLMTRLGATYYLVYDQVGTLKAVFDADGALVKRVDYDSFGNILTDTAPAFTVPFGFAGGLHDRDTGLVHFGYRDYDPATGRWTAKDPIGFDGGLVDLYGYVANDPVNWMDPEGLQVVVDPYTTGIPIGLPLGGGGQGAGTGNPLGTIAPGNPVVPQKATPNGTPCAQPAAVGAGSPVPLGPVMNTGNGIMFNKKNGGPDKKKKDGDKKGSNGLAKRMFNAVCNALGINDKQGFRRWLEKDKAYHMRGGADNHDWDDLIDKGKDYKHLYDR